MTTNHVAEQKQSILTLVIGTNQCLGQETIALFTVNFSHLHYNVFERGCESISGKKCKIGRN